MKQLKRADDLLPNILWVVRYCPKDASLSRILLNRAIGRLFFRLSPGGAFLVWHDCLVHCCTNSFAAGQLQAAPHRLIANRLWKECLPVSGAAVS